MEELPPRISEHYDDLAAFWDEITSSPKREQVLWDALEPMLPRVDDRRVLDAGCGSGVYAERLVDRGADVIGIDVSESMLREARERVPEADFEHADLSESIDVLADDSVDVVLCQHVFSHLQGLATPYREFARVLEPGGTLVVSTHNPVHDYLVVRDRSYPAIGSFAEELDPSVESPVESPTYAETERYDVTWGDDAVANRGTYYRRSLESLLSPLFESGFVLEALAEPTPDESTARDHPDLAAELQAHPPESLCFRATLAA